jgi:hypothetical protein
MSEHTLYTFETADAEGVVDAKQGKINGVSMITGGLTAKGHGLEVDDTTLKQIYACARKMGKVPVKTNHGTGVDAVNGFLTNFRIDEDKVRGDWTMLQAYKSTPHLLEMAEKMPGCIGLSVAFRGDPETKDGRKVMFNDKKVPYTLNSAGTQVPLAAGEKIFARCEELVSTDLVASPAANPGGMFSSGSVDKRSEDMATPSTPNPAAAAASAAEPSLTDVMNAIKGLTDRMDTIEAAGQGDAEGDDDSVELTEEQIAQGLKEGWLTEGEDGELTMVGEPADDDGQGADDGQGEDDGEGVDAEATEHAAQAALQRGDNATYFQIRHQQAMQRIEMLENRFAAEDAARVATAERQATQSLAAKIGHITELSAQQRDQLAAKDELIRELQSGAPRVRSVGSETLFSVQTLGGGEVTFESEVSKVNTALMTAAPTLSEFSRKAQALETVQKARPDLYQQHLKAKGVRA